MTNAGHRTNAGQMQDTGQNAGQMQDTGQNAGQIQDNVGQIQDKCRTNTGQIQEN